MAGDWIKMRDDLHDDPAVIGICTALDLDGYAVVGRLHKLWAWADRQSRDGHAPTVTQKWIDRYVDLDGFASAMVRVGWLKVSDRGISFPHFDRHNGKSAKTRALAADRQRNARITPTSRKQRDKSVTREEKRRDITPLPPSGAFLRFWEAWPKHPRKQSQGKCWERWRKSDLDQVADRILAHVESLKGSADWRKENGAYIPAPMVYLNQQRWEGAESSEPDPEQKRMVM